MRSYLNASRRTSGSRRELRDSVCGWKMRALHSRSTKGSGDLLARRTGEVDAVLQGSWKLGHRIKTGGFELYDLKDFWSSAGEYEVPAPDHHRARRRAPGQPTRLAGHQLEAFLVDGPPQP